MLCLCRLEPCWPGDLLRAVHPPRGEHRLHRHHVQDQQQPTKEQQQVEQQLHQQRSRLARDAPRHSPQHQPRPGLQAPPQPSGGKERGHFRAPRDLRAQGDQRGGVVAAEQSQRVEQEEEESEGGKTGEVRATAARAEKNISF